MKSNIYQDDKDDEQIEKYLYKHKRETDKEAEELIETWDVVVCKFCGKKISIFEAKLSRNGSYFICKKGH